MRKLANEDKPQVVTACAPIKMVEFGLIKMVEFAPMKILSEKISCRLFSSQMWGVSIVLSVKLIFAKI